MTEVALTREEFIAFYTKQLDRADNFKYKKYQCWHYGKTDLRELTDALYGELPNGE